MRWGKNLHAKPIRVEHASLKRFSEDSMYKSVCPLCDAGVLLILRGREAPYRLRRLGRCTFCAQQVWYTDERVCGEPFLEPP